MYMTSTLRQSVRCSQENGRTTRIDGRERRRYVHASDGGGREEKEKGRRKVGGEEEREKIDGGKDGLAIVAHGHGSESCDTCCEKTTSLSTVLQRASEKKRTQKLQKYRERRSLFFFPLR